jgi:CubicO group peptidase (beta-lactamase class C family)
MGTGQALRAAAEPHVADDRIPGLVALAARGGDVHAVALGTLTAGADRPVQRDSLFRIASVTKPITGAATLALIAEGLLGLDEPVGRLLPELASRRVLRRMDGPLGDTVPARREITVRDLLTFTFGFGFAQEMFVAEQPWPVMAAESELGLATLGWPDAGRQPGPDEWIAGLGSLPLLAQPGERWMYNTGASVLGVLLARAAGMPYGEVLRTRLFEPLGMRDTAFWTTDTGRLSTAYRAGEGGTLEVWDEPGGLWAAPRAFDDGAAGLVSTADDLLAFGRMLLHGGRPVLPEDAAAAMLTDQLTEGQLQDGGLGPPMAKGDSWSFCQAVHADGTAGWDGGFGTSFVVDPARKLAVIILTQRAFDGPFLPAVHQDIRAIAFAALG